MRPFARLYEGLERSASVPEKLALLERYFRSVPPADAAWALHFLMGNRLKRAVKIAQLRTWAAEFAGVPEWLVEECQANVGDIGETLALMLPIVAEPAPLPLARLVEERLLPFTRATPEVQRELLRQTWSELDSTQCFLWHKMLAGNFDARIDRRLIERALAGIAGVDTTVMAHRLTLGGSPSAAGFQKLVQPGVAASEPAPPFPFSLARSLDRPSAELGEVSDWRIEWKWDGIRAQLSRRAGQCLLWSRSESILTAGFPEIVEAARHLPDGTVLDGTLLAWRDERPLASSELHPRLRRRSAGRLQAKSAPVVFMAYDLIEVGGVDWRGRGLVERRRRLEDLIAAAAASARRDELNARQGFIQREMFAVDPAPSTPAPCPLRLSPWLRARDWASVAELHASARAAGADGLLLKQSGSTYGEGRERSEWWKWTAAPYTCEVVLVGARSDNGATGTEFVEYTVAVWHEGELLPVAKAPVTRLTEAEMEALDAFVRANTIARFGPVRSVKPELVVQLEFEGIFESTRHKAGVKLRSPRIVRRLDEKQASDAESLEGLRRWLRGL